MFLISKGEPSWLGFWKRNQLTFWIYISTQENMGQFDLSKRDVQDLQLWRLI